MGHIALRAITEKFGVVKVFVGNFFGIISRMAKPLRKQQARLKNRQNEYDRLNNKDQNERKRPGSMNRKKK